VEARRDLEAIVHPRVRAMAAELESAAPADAVVVHVIPLLVETGQAGKFDSVIVVDIDPQVQLERLMRRNQLSADQARARLRAQATREERLAVADIVIDNNGTLYDLARQVDRVWLNLTAGAVGR
jgi:dephospho-CoA kinase